MDRPSLPLRTTVGVPLVSSSSVNSTLKDSISKREATGRVALDLSDLGIEMPRTRRLDGGRLRMRRQGGYAPTA